MKPMNRPATGKEMNRQRQHTGIADNNFHRDTAD